MNQINAVIETEAEAEKTMVDAMKAAKQPIDLIKLVKEWHGYHADITAKKKLIADTKANLEKLQESRKEVQDKISVETMDRRNVQGATKTYLVDGDVVTTRVDTRCSENSHLQEKYVEFIVTKAEV